MKKPSIAVRKCDTESHRTQKWNSQLMNHLVNFTCGSQIQINTKDKGETTIMEIR